MIECERGVVPEPPVPSLDSYSLRQFIHHDSWFLLKILAVIQDIFLVFSRFFRLIRRVYISHARSNWYWSRNQNLYNPTFKSTVYAWGSGWNIARYGVHHTGFKSQQQAIDVAFKMWLKESVHRKFKNYSH